MRENIAFLKLPFWVYFLSYTNISIKTPLQKAGRHKDRKGQVQWRTAEKLFSKYDQSSLRT